MTQPHSRALRTITLGDLLAEQFPHREDMVFPWLLQGESAMLWAAPGTGKTLLALTLALMVAGGGAALGWTSPKPRRELFVDGEMSVLDLQERARWLMDTIEGIDRAAAADNLRFLSRTLQTANTPFPDLNDRDGRGGSAAGQDVILETATRHQAELMILDNFATLAEVSDENDAAAMAPTLSFLLRVKQACIGCILVHHSGKDGSSYRGSSKLATTFEVIIGLRQSETPCGSAGAAFKLEWTKYRREPHEAIRSRRISLVKDPAGPSRWVSAPTEDEDLRRALDAVQSGQFATQNALAQELGWDKSKVTRMKARAVKDGAITEAVWNMCMRDGAQAHLEPPHPDF